MKITFKEILSSSEWLHSELINSLTDELITKASNDQFYDVKLIVNGVELEPLLFNKIMNNIEKCIREEAKSLIREELEEVENKVNNLSYIFDNVKNKLFDEYDINETNF